MRTRAWEVRWEGSKTPTGNFKEASSCIRSKDYLGTGIVGDNKNFEINISQ